MIKDYKEYVSQIKEGLIITHNIDNAISILEMNLNSIIGNNFILNKVSNYIFQIELNYDINIKFIDVLFTIINNCGYFPSYLWLNDKINSTSYKYNYDRLIKDINNKNITYLKIRCEAKYDDLIDTYGTFYHVCKKQNLDKILKIGLVPKSKSKTSYHPDRIYLLNNISDAENLINRFNFYDSSSEYIILKININKEDNIKLYNDPNYNKKGCYTYDNINKNNISIVK
jgi:hypothetical protein